MGAEGLEPTHRNGEAIVLPVDGHHIRVEVAQIKSDDMPTLPEPIAMSQCVVASCSTEQVAASVVPRVLRVHVNREARTSGRHPSPTRAFKV
jgi:hypothetical protein